MQRPPSICGRTHSEPRSSRGEPTWPFSTALAWGGCLELGATLRVLAWPRGPLACPDGSPRIQVQPLPTLPSCGPPVAVAQRSRGLRAGRPPQGPASSVWAWWTLRATTTLPSSARSGWRGRRRSAGSPWEPLSEAALVSGCLGLAERGQWEQRGRLCLPGDGLRATTRPGFSTCRADAQTRVFT